MELSENALAKVIRCHECGSKISLEQDLDPGQSTGVHLKWDCESTKHISVNFNSEKKGKFYSGIISAICFTDTILFAIFPFKQSLFYRYLILNITNSYWMYCLGLYCDGQWRLHSLIKMKTRVLNWWIMSILFCNMYVSYSFLMCWTLLLIMASEFCWKLYKKVHTGNKNFVSLLLFRELQRKKFFELLKGIYHLEPGGI